MSSLGFASDLRKGSPGGTTTKDGSGFWKRGGGCFRREGGAHCQNLCSGLPTQLVDDQMRSNFAFAHSFLWGLIEKRNPKGEAFDVPRA